MTEDFDNHSDQEKELVKRFEDSLSANLNLFFGEEELEDIIRYYHDHFKYRKALKTSEWALSKFPFSIEIKLLMAQSHIFLDEVEEGLEILENLNNISPNNEDIVLTLANAMSILDQNSDAIQLLQNFIPLAEDKAEVFYLLGNFYRIENKTGRPLNALKRP